MESRLLSAAVGSRATPENPNHNNPPASPPQKKRIARGLADTPTARNPVERCQNRRTASSETDCLAVKTASTDDSPLLGACVYTAEVREQTVCEDCPEFHAGRDGFCDRCPDGTRVLDNGDDLTDCEICPEGWVGTDSVCWPCGIGQLPNFPNTVEPPVWDTADHIWIAQTPARTECLDCPQYMYSPEGKECFWCGPGEIVNSARSGCEDCPSGQYGLIDDRLGEAYF